MKLTRLGQWVRHALSYTSSVGGRRYMSRAMHDSVQSIMEQTWTFVREHERRMLGGVGGSNAKGWIMTKHAKAYVIAAQTFYNDKFYYTLELCNISVYAQYQGKGFCSTLLHYMERLCQEHNRLFIIQNVINTDFDRFLMRRSSSSPLVYERVANFRGDPCFYLRPPEMWGMQGV